MKLKGYLATHFFNEAGFKWTEKIAKRIRKETNLALYVPQENDEINDKEDVTAEITDIDIAEADNKYLYESNILIASLDGVEIDSGVSAEIGYFSGLMRAESVHCVNPRPRIIIGLYTDMRQDGEGVHGYYINLYTKGLANMNGKVVRTVDEVIEIINDFEKSYKFMNQVGV